MSSVLVFQASVKDQVAFKAYASAVDPTVQIYGGRTIVRAKKLSLIEGKDTNNHILACIAFDTEQQALAWYNSPEYEDLLGDRAKGIDVDVSMYELIDHE